MIDLYNRLKILIQTIDFNKLYRNFKQCNFALYNKKHVYFNDKTIDYDERFIGNTTIDYDGEYIAIWDLAYTVDDDEVFASKIIHEMFHAYQMREHETRFPNVFLGINYNYNKTNLIWKYSETMYLVEAYKSNSMNAYQQFVSSRRDRQLKYINETEYESKIETVEGMARFVELQALFQFNPQKYHKEMNNLIRDISNINNYLPIRTICYNIGALQLIVAKQLGIEIDHEISVESNPIFSLLSVSFKEKKPYELQNFNTDFIERYYQKMEEQIQLILKSPHEVILCDSITGLDPMNTFKIDDYYFFKYFVRIKCEGTERNMFGQLLGKLDEFGNVKKIYKPTS